MEPGGQLDIQQLLAAAAQMGNQLMSAQQELADSEVEGSAGGGLVKVTVNGAAELVDLTISPEAIEAGDPAETAQTLADLVLAACRDAYHALEDLQADVMGPVAGGLGGGFGGPAGMPGLPPGMPDLAGLSGLLGQPGQAPLPGTVQPDDDDDYEDDDEADEADYDPAGSDASPGEPEPGGH
jgi:nucleoid-associated protein EbfC